MLYLFHKALKNVRVKGRTFVVKETHMRVRREMLSVVWKRVGVVGEG